VFDPEQIQAHEHVAVNDSRDQESTVAMVS
jgi:hypothetical protein